MLTANEKIRTELIVNSLAKARASIAQAQEGLNEALELAKHYELWRSVGIATAHQETANVGKYIGGIIGYIERES